MSHSRLVLCAVCVVLWVSACANAASSAADMSGPDGSARPTGLPAATASGKTLPAREMQTAATSVLAVTPLPPTRALPATGATVTPPISPAPTYTPATPCADQACAWAVDHFWLERPVPSQGGFVNHVDRTYPYGSTQGGQREPHHGVEFANPAGVPVLAAASGQVVVAGDDSTTAYGPATHFYGQLVIVQLDEDYEGEPVFNLYGHLQDVSVSVGTHVETGDLLGTVGSTGVALGAHLHFEVRVGENDYLSTRNPELWFKPVLYGGRPWGAIAGRVVDTGGHLLPGQTVVIRPVSIDYDFMRHHYLNTYAQDVQRLNGDDRLQENFAISDIPPGIYSVTVNTARFYQQTVTVTSGQIAWVAFVVAPPPPTETPPTETPMS